MDTDSVADILLQLSGAPSTATSRAAKPPRDRSTPNAFKIARNEVMRGVDTHVTSAILYAHHTTPSSLQIMLPDEKQQCMLKRMQKLRATGHCFLRILHHKDVDSAATLYKNCVFQFWDYLTQFTSNYGAHRRFMVLHGYVTEQIRQTCSAAIVIERN